MPGGLGTLPPRRPADLARRTPRRRPLATLAFEREGGGLDARLRRRRLDGTRLLEAFASQPLLLRQTQRYGVDLALYRPIGSNDRRDVRSHTTGPCNATANVRVVADR